MSNTAIVYVKGENINLFIKEGAENKSLVLLHPALAQAVFYEGLAEELNKAGYTTVAVDFPNHGSSGGVSRTSIEQYANFVEDLIPVLQENQIVGSEVVLVGWSMGGTTSYEVATRNPEWLDSIVMLSSSNRWEFGELPFTREEYDNGLKSRENEDPKQKYIRDFLDTSKFLLPPFSSCAGDWDACRTYDGRQKASDIKVPVLRVYGDKDELGAYEANVDMNAYMPETQCVLHLQGDHNLPAMKPDFVAADITTFLEEN